MSCETEFEDVLPLNSVWREREIDSDLIPILGGRLEAA